MTGVRVTIDDRQLSQALRELARVGRDPSPALKALGPLLVASTRNRITAEQAPDGTAWPALNPAYAAGKRGPGMLRERAMRGGLFASLTSEVDGAKLRVGTNKVYAAVHQFGATITPRNAPALVFRLGKRLVRAKKVTIPARPFLGISEEDRETIADVFEAFARRVTGQR
jgi:phage virion morphogenesis protein